MHELFETVLTHRDLSRAGQLFALSDDLIRHDLSQVLQQVETIVSEPGYSASSSDQSLVEISLSRVTACIRVKNNIEEHMAALLSLLDSCLAHELSPTDAQRDANLASEYSPHGKIASDLLSCIFLNYDRKWVMQLALPVAAKYLLKGNSQLIRNVTSFLCLTSSDHRELLSHQAGVLLESVVTHGNEELLRVLPSLFPFNRDVFVRAAGGLAAALKKCKELENRNHCLQLLSLIGAENPSSLRLQLGVILEATDASNSVLVSPLLLSLSRLDPSPFADHLPLIRAHLQPLWPGMLPALLSILSGLCRNQARLHECCGLLVFYLEHLPRIEQTLDVLRALEGVAANAGPAVAPFVGRVERAAKSLGPPGAALVAGMKLHTRRTSEGGCQSPGSVRLNVAIQTEELRADLMPTLQSASSVRLPPSTAPRDFRPSSVSTVLASAATPAPPSSVGAASAPPPSVPASVSSRRSSQAPSPAPSSLSSSAHAPRLRYKTRSSNTLLSVASTATGTTVASMKPPPQPVATPLMTPPPPPPPPAASLDNSRSRFSSQMTSRSRLQSVTELVDGEPVGKTRVEQEAVEPTTAPQMSVEVATVDARPRTLRASILPESPPSTDATLPLLLRQPSQRDAISAFSDKHASKMGAFVDSILPRLPLPVRCVAADRRHLLLHFACARNTIHCVCAGSNCVGVRTRQARPWIHLVFLAHQAGRSRAGAVRPRGLDDPTVAELRATWESMRASGSCRFVALATSSFPTGKQIEALRRELQDAHFFDTFEFHSAHGQWACNLCRSPVEGEVATEVEVEGGRNGGTPITVQLKQKRGRLKFLRRWKTRYFTLSGAHIIYSKQRQDTSVSDEAGSSGAPGGQLPVSSIQSVKAIRRRHRDLPRAYEIFTDDNRKLLVKAVGDEDVGGWVRQLQIALARSQNSFMSYGMPPPAMDLATAQTNGPSSEVSPLFGRASGRDSSRRQKQSCL